MKFLKKLLKNGLTTKSQQCDVLFYSSHYVDEIWTRTTALACARHGMKVMVASGNNLPDNIAAIYKNGIPLLNRVSGDKIKNIEPQIVVTASSGLNKSYFSSTVRELVHMPHSISSLHMIYPVDAFDGYTRLFCVGPHHDAEMKTIAKRRNLQNFTQTHAIGYGKLDLLKDELRKKHETLQTSPLILLAPSWGAKNILNTAGVGLCEKILSAGYNLTIRPHPMFFIEKYPLLDEMKSRFAEWKEFSIEQSLSLGEAIFHADLLITDYSGIAQEFTELTGNPVVFVDVPKKILNDTWEEYDIEPIELRSRGNIGMLCKPDPENIINAIQSTLNQRELWRSKIQDFRKNYIYDGSCAQNACTTLQSILDNKEVPSHVV